MTSGFVIIDKPEGLTSQGVVSRVRRALGIRRVGHGGTLDPIATGVLPIFVGRATRGASLLLAADKAYLAGFRCGIETDTCDITGTVLRQTGIQPSEAEVQAILPRFLGEQDQTPPMYSALKVEGRKLYELAREGLEVERKSRRITIRQLDYLGCIEGEHRIAVDCTKGSYIRELIRQIGAALGCGATMTSLRRTRTGRFTLEEAVPLDRFQEAPTLRPTDELFSDHPALTVTEDQERKIRNGASFPIDAEAGTYRVYSPTGVFLMLGRVEDGVLATVKSFYEVEEN